ncbi:MAG: TlpA disulfide reductase family protein [Maricaulaceae bacterium]|jgi:peroxiredoxin
MRLVPVTSAALAAILALTMTACTEDAVADDTTSSEAETELSPAEARVQAASAALIGQPGPAITFAALNGETIDLADSYGSRPVYLKMWATWCVECRQQTPHLKETYARIADDFTVVAVATGFSETEADVRAFIDEAELAMPVAIDDGTLAAALNLRLTPLHVVIGRDGRIAHIGHLADDALEAALVAAAAQTGSTVAGQAPASIAPLSILPDQVLTLIDGATIDLRLETDSRPTVLVFLSPWCESYLAETQPQRSARCREVREAVDALSAESELRWIGVASGLWAEQADVEAYRDGYGVALSLAYDETGDLFRSFGVSAVPAIIVADADGRIGARIDDATQDPNWERALRDALERAAQ